ncbi:hypothetical protein Tco_0778856 [Tanacetum coccineum]
MNDTSRSVWSTDYYHHKQWNLVDQRAIQVLGKGFGNKGHLRITTPSKRSGGTGKKNPPCEHSCKEESKTNVTPRKEMMGRRILAVAWAHRTMPNTSNKETPFNLAYDIKAVIPAEIGQAKAAKVRELLLSGVHSQAVLEQEIHP